MTDHWNELNLRMERAFQEQKRASESRALRDHFAAAALTGLLARPDVDADPLEHHFCCEDAYRWADAMLRCRGGGDCPLPDNAPNHDAAVDTPKPHTTRGEGSEQRKCTEPKAARGLLERLGDAT